MVKPYSDWAILAIEATGDTLSLITWVAFGASVVPFVIHELT